MCNERLRLCYFGHSFSFYYRKNGVFIVASYVATRAMFIMGRGLLWVGWWGWQYAAPQPDPSARTLALLFRPGAHVRQVPFEVGVGAFYGGPDAHRRLCVMCRLYVSFIVSIVLLG